MKTFPAGFKILTSKEKIVYKLRLKGLTLQVIAEKLNISNERVRQLETEALRSIKKFDNPGAFGFLSVRSVNCLRENGIKSIEEARNKSDEKLLSLKNFGKVSLKELRENKIPKNFCNVSLNSY